eukprot:8238350-Pyramimonas_sp.AAC.1
MHQRTLAVGPARSHGRVRTGGKCDAPERWAASRPCASSSPTRKQRPRNGLHWPGVQSTGPSRSDEIGARVAAPPRIGRRRPYRD